MKDLFAPCGTVKEIGDSEYQFVEFMNQLPVGCDGCRIRQRQIPMNSAAIVREGRCVEPDGVPEVSLRQRDTNKTVV